MVSESAGNSLSAGGTRTGIDIQGDELIGFDGHLGWSYSRRHLFRSGLIICGIFMVLEGGVRATGGGGRRAQSGVYRTMSILPLSFSLS